MTHEEAQSLEIARVENLFTTSAAIVGQLVKGIEDKGLNINQPQKRYNKNWFYKPDKIPVLMVHLDRTIKPYEPEKTPYNINVTIISYTSLVEGNTFQEEEFSVSKSTFLYQVKKLEWKAGKRRELSRVRYEAYRRNEESKYDSLDALDKGLVRLFWVAKRVGEPIGVIFDVYTNLPKTPIF